MRKLVLVVALAFSFVLLWAGSAGAGKLTVAQQCEKARIKADIELASCMGKAKLKGIKGQPGEEEARAVRCRTQHIERFRKAKARAERKGGSCPTPEPVAETTEAPSWLMVQDSGSVTFDFDDSIDEGCPAEAFWSGTMTMGDADPETLWFSDRPDRVAFTQTTDEFVTGFVTTFTASTGGDPNAVLNWQDPADDFETHAVLELRYVAGTSPQYDGDAGVLTYSVCGLRLDDPDTLQPLPESEQVEPPESVSSIGNITLFIDPTPSPALGSEPTQLGPFYDVQMYDYAKQIPPSALAVLSAAIPGARDPQLLVGWWMYVNAGTRGKAYIKITGFHNGNGFWPPDPWLGLRIDEGGLIEALGFNGIIGGAPPASPPQAGERAGSYYDFTVSFCDTNPCPCVQVPWSSNPYPGGCTSGN